MREWKRVFLMLPKQNRLKRDKDFKQLFKSGKKVGSPLFFVRFAKNGLDDTRVAVVVGGKVSKSAVKRNRLRRQVREMLRLRVNDLKPGFDVAIMLGKDTLGMKYEELEPELFRVLKRAELI